ncbi:MAG TPA: hypothetical protein PKD37_03355 [Oligoflexia bacterium]|nr:hypothetical protein [Oligoflexia bacterium]HMP27006.1 hypothetical protein [Oligoflexia bacterium]
MSIADNTSSQNTNKIENNVDSNAIDSPLEPFRLTISALCADNSENIAKIISLFQRCYGTSYPIAGVLKREFWRSRIGKRFCSVIIEASFQDDSNRNQSTTVAHFAVTDGKPYCDSATITFMALNPDFYSAKDFVFKSFIDFLSKLAQKRGWRSLRTHSVYTDNQPDSQEAVTFNPFDLNKFGFIHTALMPEFLGKLGIGVFCKSLASSSLQIETTNLPEKYLKIILRESQTKNSDEKIKYLNSLKKEAKIKEKITSSIKKGPDNDQLAGGIVSADLPGLDEINCPSLKVVNLIIQPSLLAENENKEVYARLLQKDSSSRLYVIVNGADRKFVQFADTLEQVGCECTGYLPEFRGSTYFIFSASKKLSSSKMAELESLTSKNLFIDKMESGQIKLAQTASDREKGRIPKKRALPSSAALANRKNQRSNLKAARKGQ